MKIACSACHTILPPGALACPGCKLPLSSQAVPVTIQRQPLIHPLQWLVIIVTLLVILYVLADKQHDRDMKQDEASHAAHNAELDREAAVVAAVSTPATFEAKCGKAQKRYNRLLPEDHLDDMADPSNPTTLIYRNGTSETHVSFFKSAMGPVIIEHTAGYRFTPKQYEGLRDLGCVK